MKNARGGLIKYAPTACMPCTFSPKPAYLGKNEAAPSKNLEPSRRLRIEIGPQMNYQFEWDWVKNLKNTVKHGINFSDASQLWYRYDSIFGDAKTVDDEERENAYWET